MRSEDQFYEEEACFSTLLCESLVPRRLGKTSSSVAKLFKSQTFPFKLEKNFREKFLKFSLRWARFLKIGEKCLLESKSRSCCCCWRSGFFGGSNFLLPSFSVFFLRRRRRSFWKKPSLGKGRICWHGEKLLKDVASFGCKKLEPIWPENWGKNVLSVTSWDSRKKNKKCEIVAKPKT